MLSDLRHALRSLSKSPGFVLTATACLGLALALNTTTFAILDAMLHPPLPVKHADRLFYVGFWPLQRDQDAPAWERYQVLRAGKFYEEIGFLDWVRGATIRAGDEVSDRPLCRVSSNFYSVLGVSPELGRLPGPGGPEDVAVVSHDFWERALGGRPLDGLTVWANERPYRVVAVIPSAMTFPPADVAIPVPRTLEQSGSGLSRLTPVLRVRRGLTQRAMAAQLEDLARRLTLEYGAAAGPYAFVPHSIAPQPLPLRQIHFAMAGAAFLVLLISCANLASLMLVRGTARRREIALRLALGAGRAAVVRHLAAEAAVIAAAGMVAGLLLTLWAVPVLASQMPPSVELLGIVKPQASWRVFAAGTGIAMATIALFGLWPALRASDVDVSEPLKDSAAIAGKARWRYHPVVVVEIALSLVLLMGVTLLTKAAARLSESTLGFDRTGLLEARVWLGGVVPPDSAQKISRLLLERVANLPQVHTVAAAGDVLGRSVESEFYHGGVNGILEQATVFEVSHGFLQTVGVPVLQGRDLVSGDEQTGAAIVDQAAASALWPDHQALGRVIRIEPGGRWLRVVGVARHAQVAGPPTEEPGLAPEGVVYRAWQPETPTYGWRLAIRVPELDALAAVRLRHVIQETLPGGRAIWVQPWLFFWETELHARYFLVAVFSAFGGFALLLATVGLYGVVSYAVSRRMREFAVRMAVGAPRQDMVKLVAHDAAAMTLAGIGLGALLAMWASTLLGSWLYDVYHTDAMSLVTAEAVLLIVAVAACLQPALRAMRADPIEILRAI